LRLSALWGERAGPGSVPSELIKWLSYLDKRECDGLIITGSYEFTDNQGNHHITDLELQQAVICEDIFLA
jgi:hypothetical protein